MGILELAIAVIVVKLDWNEADIMGPCSWSTCSVLGMAVEAIDVAKLSYGCSNGFSEVRKDVVVVTAPLTGVL